MLHIGATEPTAATTGVSTLPHTSFPSALPNSQAQYSNCYNNCSNNPMEEAQDSIVECPGCSLIYDTTPLFGQALQ
jgi:hypothetical protein